MRFVYLHGFASGPTSRKARAFENSLAECGIRLEIPELDRGDFEHLTIGGQVRILEALLRGSPARLIGSSLGGYIAALYASIHPETSRLVLLAPAFDPQLTFERSIGPEKLAAWRAQGYLEILHYAAGDVRRIHYGFMEDAAAHLPFPDFLQPAMLFHGTRDDVIPITVSRAFVATHSNVELVELITGHDMLEAIDEVITRALPFLLAD